MMRIGKEMLIRRLLRILIWMAMNETDLLQVFGT